MSNESVSMQPDSSLISRRAAKAHLAFEYAYAAADLLDEVPTIDAVPIDEMFCEMMNWAVRYALGRRTYAASDTAMYALELVPKLDDKTLTVMAQDIRERGENLGDECDAVWWRRLLDAAIDEMVRRKDNGERHMDDVLNGNGRN